MAAGKRFDQWVFRDLSVALPHERTTAIVGPSGCGKTTLLQLINAVHRPDEGRVEIFGEAVPESDLAVFRRDFGYAVQGAGLFPHLTVADNVALVARLERWPQQAIVERRRELLDIVGLSSELDGRYPHQLSGGQQQRVGLCRALMLRPRMLLLDEPFAGVDPITRADLYPRVRATSRSRTGDNRAGYARCRGGTTVSRLPGGHGIRRRRSGRSDCGSHRCAVQRVRP